MGKTAVILGLILAVCTTSFSKNQKQMSNSEIKTEKTVKEKIGLLVILKAKKEKEEEVKNFLLSGKAIVQKESRTISWYAFQIDESTFGIYDTFDDETGRSAHFNGEVAKSLLASAPELLDAFSIESSITSIDVLAFNKTAKLDEKKGLLVIMNAKKGKESNVKSFLESALPLVKEETQTMSWYAIDLGNGKFGIFDTFATDSGREAHINGKIAAALLKNATQLLENFQASDIQTIDILAIK